MPLHNLLKKKNQKTQSCPNTNHFDTACIVYDVLCVNLLFTPMFVQYGFEICEFFKKNTVQGTNFGKFPVHEFFKSVFFFCLCEKR